MEEEWRAVQIITLRVAVHVKCKLKGRQKTSLGEVGKADKDNSALRKQRMIKGFKITLARAMVAQTAWHCSLLLCQLHSDSRYNPFFLFVTLLSGSSGQTYFYCRLSPSSCQCLRLSLLLLSL